MQRSELLAGGATSEHVRRRDRISARLADFRGNEDGSLLIFGLFMFVIMLIVAGVSLDVMRFEERRTTLQATTDRAVLAAADLRQTLPAKDVVKDYFKKAGLTPPSDSQIIVNQGTFNEWRTVQANTSETLPTWFMNMFGIKTMSPISSSTAEERIGNVEISLVLDVSGSMNSNSRLTNLKPAAKSFIDQMFDTVEPGKLSMSIISYSAQASIGPDLIKYFAIDPTSGAQPAGAASTVTSCIDFVAADFNSTTMKPKSTAVGLPAGPLDYKYKLNGLFDPFYTNWVDLSTTSNSLTHCPADNYVTNGANKNKNRDALAFSGDRATLKNKIDALVASGNTSIDIGMKWGAALLDPSMNPIVQNLISEGKVASNFSNRPLAYKKANGSWNDEVLKVIILMTDGENTTEYKLNNGYKVGASPLFKDTSNTYSATDIKKYSLWDASKGKYYRFKDSGWYTTPTGSVPTNMSWDDVWALMSVNYYARYVIYPAYGNTEYNKWITSNASAKATTYIDATKDTQTLAMCSAAKGQNIKIYTIGFEAPSAGQTLLKSCATTPANFYSVAGLDIKTAFSSIASSINKLRLTH